MSLLLMCLLHFLNQLLQIIQRNILLFDESFHPEGFIIYFPVMPGNPVYVLRSHLSSHLF